MSRLQLSCLLVFAQTFTSLSFVLTAIPSITRATFEESSIQLGPRAISTELSTCGYLNGDPDKARTADPGWNCRVDTRNGLWGFCPTTVLTASDCGLAGYCIDKGPCSTGCGMDDTDLTTFTCGRNSWCSTAILTFGIDQSYSYLACGRHATVENYLASPTTLAETKTTATEQTTSQEPTAVSSDTSSTTIEVTEQTATQTTSSSSEEKSENTANNNLGPIIGGVIGGLVVISSTILGAIFLLRRNRKRDDKADSPKEDAANIFEAKPPQELQGGWGIIAEMPAEQKARGPVELAA
ncbi:hypothetical protein FSHL1_009004 [Fusarium sambucinum]